MNDTNRYLIKIIPPTGYAVYKLELGRRHVAALAGLLFALVLVALGVHTYQLRAAQAHLEELQALTRAQNAKLGAIDAQAGKLTGDLQRLERQNQEIRRAMGISSASKRQGTREMHAAVLGGSPTVARVESDLARLAQASRQARDETVALRHLASRILNMRRLEAIAHAELLAAIPSVVPAGSGEVASGFGYRSSPWPEFHKGVDLAADYGQIVRAAAKGTVASAGWDGGFGQKVDIDHGNGLHTWYAHLSRIDVRVGQTVLKGAPIAAVGSTGESTGPHLHYQVMENGSPIDPAPFLVGEGAKILGLDTSASPRR